MLLTFIEKVQNVLPTLERKPESSSQPSPEMEKLQQELDKMKLPPSTPGSEDDPAIPEEDQDEYHPQSTQEGGEKQKAQVLFEITPPLTGHFRTGSLSYYDRERRVWSKQKNLSQYTEGVLGQKRYTISGQLPAGKLVPSPYQINTHWKQKRSNFLMEQKQLS